MNGTPFSATLPTVVWDKGLGAWNLIYMVRYRVAHFENPALVGALAAVVSAFLQA